MRVNMVDISPEPGDTPRRMFHDNGRHYVEFAGEWGPVLRLRDLTEAEQMTYLKNLAVECQRLCGEIERHAIGKGGGS